MLRARALTEDEIHAVCEAFEGQYRVRDRFLFMFAVLIGSRVSELITFTVGDVYENGYPVSHVQITKTDKTRRSIPVNADAREVIEELIAWHRLHFGRVRPDHPLFPSRKRGGGMAPLQRQAVSKIFKVAYVKAGLAGNLTTETPRKTFAQRLYNQTGNLYLVRMLLGHTNEITTLKYLDDPGAYLGRPDVNMELAEKSMEILKMKEKPEEEED